jgi:hypothetical protein
VILLTCIGSAVNLWQSLGDHVRLYSASLIFVLSWCALLTALYGRIFALRAQDRVIRVEENLRHYLLTGKPLDSRIDVKQAIALRFASDAELPALAERTVGEGLKPDDIKRAIKNWRADEYRV